MQVFDGYIRNDSSLMRSFPIGVVVAEQCIIPVSQRICLLQAK